MARMLLGLGAVIRFRSTPVYAIFLLFIAATILYGSFYSGFQTIKPRSGEPWNAANATLGFGGLFVVSAPSSKRRDQLLQAAAVTELEMTVPLQTDWQDSDIDRFRGVNESQSNVKGGSVKAWLSHHLVLHAFLDSGVETALIFEDDIDWDIHLRTSQIPMAQQAARKLLGQESSPSSEYPWGNPQDWDLLYLGHCGDYWGDVEEGTGVGYVHPSDLASTPHVSYKDQTVLRPSNLHPFTASLLTALDVPERTRIFHRSKHPLCTFGYALTRSTAERLIHEIAPAKEDPARNIKAYDVAIMAACRDSYLLRCYSLTPELFHHMEGRSIIGTLEKSAFRPPVDAAGFKQVEWRGETSNIECGFWSGEFYYNAEPEKLPFLQKEVGKKNRCLKPGRES